MLFADTLYLIKEITDTNAMGDSVGSEFARQVFCEVQSIGLKRKMDALVQGIKLEYKFILSNFAEYDGEEVLEYKGKRYNIVNSYIQGETIELVVARY